MYCEEEEKEGEGERQKRSTVHKVRKHLLYDQNLFYNNYYSNNLSQLLIVLTVYDKNRYFLSSLVSFPSTTSVSKLSSNFEATNAFQ